MNRAMLDLYTRSYVEDLKWTMEEFDREALARVVALLLSARDQNRQILLLGNGGSAAAASHMACDLGKGTIDFSDNSFRRFRVISLSDNNALMTAIGNDLSYEDVFVEQLRMLMHDGDVIVFISSSGNSPNLVRAAEYARTRGAVMVGLLGFGGGKLASMMDVPMVVSSRNYGITEDFHLSVQHVYTQYLRRALAGAARPVAFVDRDGIINERAAAHEYVERWEDFRFRIGSLALLQKLTTNGFSIVVVTNQQGVGKGRLTAADLRAMHDKMTERLATDGVKLAGIFACPHLEERGCFCRKPAPGLIYRAINELPFLIDLQGSLIIGDSPTDVAAGLAAGIPTRLLVASRPDPAATQLVPDLAALIQALPVPVGRT